MSAQQSVCVCDAWTVTVGCKGSLSLDTPSDAAPEKWAEGQRYSGWSALIGHVLR